jgi:hypothetical protein
VDNKTIFEIKPFLSAGLVFFDMSPERVAAAIGPADDANTNHLNQLVEYRAFMNVGYTSTLPNLVNHMGFGRQMLGLRMEGIEFFQDNPLYVLRELMQKDKECYLYLGFVVFLNLGITLTGFHDNDLSQKAVALFKQGSWDMRIPKMQRFDLTMVES